MTDEQRSQTGKGVQPEGAASSEFRRSRKWFFKTHPDHPLPGFSRSPEIMTMTPDLTDLSRRKLLTDGATAIAGSSLVGSTSLAATAGAESGTASKKPSGVDWPAHRKQLERRWLDLLGDFPKETQEQQRPVHFHQEIPSLHRRPNSADPGGHNLPGVAQRNSFAWFDRWLGGTLVELSTGTTTMKRHFLGDQDAGSARAAPTKRRRGSPERPWTMRSIAKSSCTFFPSRAGKPHRRDRRKWKYAGSRSKCRRWKKNPPPIRPEIERPRPPVSARR